MKRFSTLCLIAGLGACMFIPTACTKQNVSAAVVANKASTTDSTSKSGNSSTSTPDDSGHSGGCRGGNGHDNGNSGS